MPPAGNAVPRSRLVKSAPECQPIEVPGEDVERTARKPTAKSQEIWEICGPAQRASVGRHARRGKSVAAEGLANLERRLLRARAGGRALRAGAARGARARGASSPGRAASRRNWPPSGRVIPAACPIRRAVSPFLGVSAPQAPWEGAPGARHGLDGGTNRLGRISGRRGRQGRMEADLPCPNAPRPLLASSRLVTVRERP